jgi:hypothetical protein
MYKLMNTSSPSVLSTLLGRDASPTRDVPLEQALLTGFAATRVADAFLAGYQAALRALVPSLPANRPVCLCATEDGPVHPRHITTRIEDGRLTGKKSWVTGGPHADLLLVLANAGTDAAGKNDLRLVLVEAHAPGVTIVPLPETPFVPEIPHARVELHGVEIVEHAILPGDGWEGYVKPFRTVEDLHVHGAVLAYVLGVARRSGWPRGLMEELAAVLCATAALAAAEPRAQETHVALAGVIALGRRLLDAAEPHWERVEPEERDRWRRDRRLLDVAEKARQARTAAAWE